MQIEGPLPMLPDNTEMGLKVLDLHGNSFTGTSMLSLIVKHMHI